ncbi:phosphogluconate dehydrogenase (NADP(+)-dependent, decarboxylating) [Humibacillus sp. DSM 29435]|uniref:NADP-dependent phosphogluconate dehydrogenase n=1 Tax=Humibacillus sp. DSM 29435 TaxID=1869167 RepID=UPI0008720117|nr:NADP-dependent phosphogluconate dehydrogenase [Humibacillus sp. DSM 29435]OFE16227.1 phosphogluconate dehydrogenase (NADP(+)-dependent, decarboxylating) [Humibacillus sp. DSM 29435]
MQPTATIGVTGLSTMGRNLARNIARHGHTVAVHNRTTARMTSLIDDHGAEGDFVGCESLEDFVAAIETPRAIIVMVKAGKPTDAVIDSLTPLLDDGDIVIDAGNAQFTDTLRREKALSDQGVHFVGMGVSGGEEGALNGPSIMVGGSEHAYERIGPVVESIAAQVDGTPCAAHLGPDAAGHFVKMVHNGIEYADMQLIAESFDLLRSVGGLEPSAIADVFRDWNGGDLESFLIEMTADVLKHTDASTGKPFVDVVADAAEQKGTGRWTVQNALDLGIPVTGIAEATFARALSGHTEQRAAARKLFGGDAASHSLSKADREQFVDDVRAALYASKVVAYAQGFDQLAAGSREYDWDLDLGTVATIWRGGCIIRARFLDRIKEAYATEPDLTSLLTAEYFADAVSSGVEAWRRVVGVAVSAGVPTPAFASSLAYFDGLRRERLPAALIQVLRDNFGAHTYQRVDREGTFHTAWAEDRTESQVD